MYRTSGMRVRNSVSVFLALIFLLSGWLPTLTGLSSVRADVDTDAAPEYNATVYVYGIGEYLNVRNVAGTKNSYVIDQVFRGTRVCINKYETVPGDPSGCEKWCEIIYTSRGKTVKGHVIADYLVTDVTCSESFEREIANFPESYKPYLRLLHNKFPNWKFEAVQTTADWDSTMKVETELGNSAIPGWVPDTWKSHEEGAYDPRTGKYHEVDSGGWVNAAYDVVAYYLDPRNMLFDSQVFQFLDLGYDPKIQTEEAVSSIIGNTFMNEWDVYREPTPTPGGPVTPPPVPADIPPEDILIPDTTEIPNPGDDPVEGTPEITPVPGETEDDPKARSGDTGSGFFEEDPNFGVEPPEPTELQATAVPETDNPEQATPAAEASASPDTESEATKAPAEAQPTIESETVEPQDPVEPVTPEKPDEQPKKLTWLWIALGAAAIACGAAAGVLAVKKSKRK